VNERFNEQERRVLGYMIAGLHSQEIAAELGINGSVAKMLMEEILHELGAYEGATRPIPSNRRRRPRTTGGSELLVKLQHQIRMSWGLDPAGVARELERQARSQAKLEKYAEEWRRSHPEPPQPVSSTPRQPDLTPQETEVLRLLTEGVSARAIAAELGISRDAVRARIHAILSKMRSGRDPGSGGA
jgi:DNA-binding NarL/FixJ family response regulator